MAEIDITPAGLQTPDGVRRVSAASEALERATVDAANAASEFLRENRSTLLETTRGVAIADDDRIALRDALHQLDAVVSARARRQEILLRAVAGAPPAPNEQE